MPRKASDKGTDKATDLLGTGLSESEARLLALYRELKSVVARPDLPPCAARGAGKALACMWQVVNDLDLEFEQLYDLGV
ncbi:MAG TPA: hypothetical protein VMV15_07770 [Candidatus Binataceae bacterium]|nr:hypothetical protein [Candidatus Binataceae bacterium]